MRLRLVRGLTKQEQMLISAAQQIAEWQDLALSQARSTLDIITAWRVSMETPEIDLRDDVDGLIATYRDQVARLEEQIVSE